MLLKGFRDLRRRPSSTLQWGFWTILRQVTRQLQTLQLPHLVVCQAAGGFSRSQSAMPDRQQVAALLPLQTAHLRLCRPSVLFKFPMQRYLDSEDQAVGRACLGLEHPQAGQFSGVFLYVQASPGCCRFVLCQSFRLIECRPRSLVAEAVSSQTACCEVAQLNYMRRCKHVHDTPSRISCVRGCE